MFNIAANPNVTNREQDWRNAVLALSSWFIVNNLRTKTPMIDSVLAKIYFDTYSIPIGENLENIKEAAHEYEPDIIRFFLLNQRQRCIDIMDNIAKIFLDTNIVLPIQCKPFFEELVSLSGKISQHNIQTKETQVLDSLRDTIIVNSLEEKKTGVCGNMGFSRITIPQHTPIKTSGKYILTDGDKKVYMAILQSIVSNLYMPMFSGVTPKYVPNVYALTDLYEDSGTRFAKVIEYLKCALFMICTSYDGRLGCCDWISPTIVPSIQEDMFTTIDNLAGKCRSLEGYHDSISRECARYGGFTIPHAICLPKNTMAHLDCFKPEKNAISLTYKFLVCQMYFSLLDYKTVVVQ